MNYWIRQKKHWVCLLIFSIVLSGFVSMQSETLFYFDHTPSTSSSSSSSSSTIPLSTATCRTDVTTLQGDMSAGEITGARSLTHWINVGKQIRSQTTYQNVVAHTLWTTGNYTFTQLREVLVKYYTSGLHPIQTVIRYIHNQDGSKENSFIQ